jgi:hypothetical protein
MTFPIRRQLTLFIDQHHAHEIERIRRQFDPKQYELIASHVTLCREGEIEDIHTLLEHLQEVSFSRIALHFGAVTRSENGKGALLPALGTMNHSTAFVPKFWLPYQDPYKGPSLISP